MDLWRLQFGKRGFKRFGRAAAFRRVDRESRRKLAG
jgi:hypothetical protein